MTSNVNTFAADMLYHQPCYYHLVYSYREKSTTKTEMTAKEVSAVSAEKEFKILIKKKILIQKNCYLLTDFVEEMANL